MNNRKIIESNAVIVFNRTVKASELNELLEGFGGDVVITKKLIVDKEINISVNLYVIGGITRKSPLVEERINIDGDLYSYGEVHCNDINVSGTFYSEKVVYSGAIKVGEHLLCDDKIDAYNCDVIVAGDIECYGIMARKVYYLGKTDIQGKTSVLECMKNGC